MVQDVERDLPDIMVFKVCNLRKHRTQKNSDHNLVMNPRIQNSDKPLNPC